MQQIINAPEDGTDFKLTTGFKLTQCDKILQWSLLGSRIKGVDTSTSRPTASS